MASEIDADEARYLAAWAERYGARFQPTGECGFGRPCVGILKSDTVGLLKGDTYPAYTAFEQMAEAPWLRTIHECPEAAPPDGVKDAYHKHDCLAVLGRGPDAVHQLWLWVRHLEAQGIGITEIPRRPANDIDAMVHGYEAAVLVKLTEREPNDVLVIDQPEMRRRGPGFEAAPPGRREE